MRFFLVSRVCKNGWAIGGERQKAVEVYPSPLIAVFLTDFPRLIATKFDRGWTGLPLGLREKIISIHLLPSQEIARFALNPL